MTIIGRFNVIDISHMADHLDVKWYVRRVDELRIIACEWHIANKIPYLYMGGHWKLSNRIESFVIKKNYKRLKNYSI